mgnify:CR=1 FL=1
MADLINSWLPYQELSIENDRDPVLDDPIIYGNNIKHFTVTVYSQDGRVNKYWNARILKDDLGYCRIACPRDGKILCFNWVNWTTYMFTHDGLNELVFMPDARRRPVSQLSFDN